MFEVCYNIGNMIIMMRTGSIDMSDDIMVRLCSLCVAVYNVSIDTKRV